MDPIRRPAARVALPAAVLPAAVPAAMVLAAALAVGGCAETDRRTSAPAPSSPTGAASPTGSASGSPTPTAPGAPTTKAPTTPASPGATPPVDRTPTAGGQPNQPVITVSGQVRRGVEGGCLILESPQGRYTLIVQQPHRALLPGAQVAVTGRVDPEGVSICQEGTLLRVLSVRAR